MRRAVKGVGGVGNTEDDGKVRAEAVGLAGGSFDWELGGRADEGEARGTLDVG